MALGYRCDVAILTAVAIETESVRRLYPAWEKTQLEHDDQIYHESSFEKDGIRRRVITAQQNEMGMTAAALLAAKVIHEFRPRYLIMTGIAAGIGADQIYGDVIVPDVIWNYASGKFVSPDESPISFGEVGFKLRPISLETDKEVIQIVRDRIGDPTNEFHLHIGPMACGTAVVANSEVVDKQIRSYLPETAGLDMESYGVAYAANFCSEPRPKAIVIKSICDFANSEKSDDYQKFAAFTSSRFAQYLYENHLPLDE